MFEVEQKFHIDDREGLIGRLNDLGWRLASTQQHRDTYYNHPSRDFGETREALRVRRVDGVPMVTYKGVKLPGAVKARRELEWRLDPGDIDGSNMEELLVLLGFRSVATVCKVRLSFDPPATDTHSADLAGIVVVVDHVDEVGHFAEIEVVAADENGVEEARNRVETLGNTLGLHQTEPRSYLRMLLEVNG
ncbi:class IV adenylate cyclase [Rubripirellula tenax]|uniref:class IV adenylate cyclase n=1 Tax=Rubripirellula tenax TaxID=2528015 RepID=UPI0011B66089|nr:class IV adenylate cyclase [Rubripirellula tenax]